MIVNIGKKAPVDIGVKRSKVKYTITLKLKTVSGAHLSSILSIILKLHKMIVHIE
jgi:hypothetical protein